MSTSAKWATSVITVLSLAACGGGGGGGGGGFMPMPPNGGGDAAPVVAVSGTAAKGAALVGAAVSMSCANGAVLTGETGTDGKYAVPPTGVLYPCIGSAKQGALEYRGFLASGNTANFTVLTDLMVEAVLASASAGGASMSLSDFSTLIKTDKTFAAAVVQPVAVDGYRQVVLNVVKQALMAGDMTEADANAMLADAANFDSTPFVVGSALDKVLDNTAIVLQEADGSVKTAVKAQAKEAGDVLATPDRGATGGTGAGGVGG